jgi:hypothetical protein
MKPLNYLPIEPPVELFEQVVSATMLELAANGAPGYVIDEAVDGMRYDFDRTRQWVRKLERGAVRLNPFGRFRVIRFARMDSKMR